MQRLIVGSLVFLSILIGWLTLSLGQPIPTPRGELRIVDRHCYNLISIVFNVFEHLMELDRQGQLVPRLATHWLWRDDCTLAIDSDAV